MMVSAVLIGVVLIAREKEWDWQYIDSAARLVRLTYGVRRISDFLKVREIGKKEKDKKEFSVELASERVQEILKNLIEQPWLLNNFQLYRDVQWCLEVVESDQLGRTIVTVKDPQSDHQEELINIVNQYSKSVRRGSLMMISRKSASSIGAERRIEEIEAEISEEMKTSLSDVSSCSFDIFKLKAATKDNELFTLMHFFFRRKDLFNLLQLDSQRFSGYISRIQSGYNPDNLYHTATHAADVTQTFHYFLYTCDVAVALELTPLEVCACYLSAAVHDYEHPGVNNAYLVNTQAELAIRYNDRSVLENHHVSAAFALAMNEEIDIYADLRVEDFTRLRNLMISMVLGTDIVNHFSVLSQFKTKFSDSLSTSPEDKELCLEVLLHAADISNPTKPWPVCRRWAELVLGEFWAQGDKERELKVPLGYLMDRYTANVSKSQIGFIDVIVRPTFEALMEVFQGIDENCSNLQENRGRWANYDTDPASTTRGRPSPDP
jgi:hypothetical protein